MKYSSQNIAINQAKKQPVFSDKVMGNIRMKLRQLAEIEYLFYTQNSAQKKMKL